MGNWSFTKGILGYRLFPFMAIVFVDSHYIYHTEIIVLLVICKLNLEVSQGTQPD